MLLQACSSILSPFYELRRGLSRQNPTALHYYEDAVTTSYVFVYRYFSSSVFTASPDSTSATGLSCYVAGGTAERHHGLWKAGRICQFGDRYSP